VASCGGTKKTSFIVSAPGYNLRIVALQLLAIWSNRCNFGSVAMPAVSGGSVVAVVGGPDRPGCCWCGDGAACVEGGDFDRAESSKKIE
jgi:hypothetical protein